MNTTRETDGLWFLKSHVSIGLAQADNADGISVLVHRAPFGEAPPIHVHNGEDEVFHIIDGEMRFQVGDAVLTRRAGDTLLAPRDVPHGFRVTSPDGAQYLTITRGGFEAMVRKIGRPAPSKALPEPIEPSPEMQAELALQCAHQNIDLLGPPIA